MAWYEWPSNFSNGTEVDGFGNFIVYINSMTNNYFSLGFLVLIWMVSFGVGMMSSASKALLTSGFITFLFSVYFWKLGMINAIVPIMLIIITIVGAIVTKSETSY